MPFRKYHDFCDVLLLALACAVLAGMGVLAIGALIYAVLKVFGYAP